MKSTPSICPIYLFYGPEDYLIDQEIQKLLDRTLSSKERGLNLHVFHGEEADSREIVQAAQTVPMFAPYRFVLIHEADRIDEGKIEVLLDYIQKPSPTTCLVMYAQTPGLWKAHRAEIERVGKVQEYPRLRGKGLVSWMKNEMAGKGKTLSAEAAEYIVEVVGDRLHEIDNALEKAFLGVGKKKTIELCDVEGLVSEVKISTVFDLTEAIGNRNLEKALGMLEKTMEARAVSFRKEEEASKMDDPVPLLLSMMARQYWSILRVKKMVSCRQEAEIAKTLKMSPWNAKKLIDQGKHFSEPSLREGILKCHRTDLAIKRGRGPKDLLMEKLVIDLCHPFNK